MGATREQLGSNSGALGAFQHHRSRQHVLSSCPQKASASLVRAFLASAPPLEPSPSEAQQISQYAGGPNSRAFQRHSGAERLPSWVPQHIARFAEPLKGSAQAVVLTPKMFSPGWRWLFWGSSRGRVGASGGAGLAPKAPKAPELLPKLPKPQKLGSGVTQIYG